MVATSFVKRRGRFARRCWPRWTSIRSPRAYSVKDAREQRHAVLDDDITNYEMLDRITASTLYAALCALSRRSKKDEKLRTIYREDAEYIHQKYNIIEVLKNKKKRQREEKSADAPPLQDALPLRAPQEEPNIMDAPAPAAQNLLSDQDQELERLKQVALLGAKIRKSDEEEEEVKERSSSSSSVGGDSDAYCSDSDKRDTISSDSSEVENKTEMSMPAPADAELDCDCDCVRDEYGSHAMDCWRYYETMG
jgi:hypothetical protein